VDPRRGKRRAAESEILSLWLARQPGERRLKDTLPFIEYLEESRGDLAVAVGRPGLFYQHAMSLIRFHTLDG
jgi:hypothetical protein